MFEPSLMMQPVEQFMSAMAALINAHSDPVLDKSSIHFTRPKSPREDRNPRIWKHRRQKVSRLCVAGAPSSGVANSATTPDRAAAAARGAVSGTPDGVPEMPECNNPPCTMLVSGNERPRAPGTLVRNVIIHPHRSGVRFPVTSSPGVLPFTPNLLRVSAILSR
jgi:hypothetical protein